MATIKFEPIRLLCVEMDMDGKIVPVGRLGLTDRGILFEYDPTFPKTSHNLSPLAMKEPVGSTAIPAPMTPFDGLHGVFNDSLPDGWGRLLMDRKLLDLKIHPQNISPLDRLAWIGNRGMGALRYRPEHPAIFKNSDDLMDLDRLAQKALRVLQGSASVVIDDLIRIGGSPGGARPKALIGRSGDGKDLIHGVEDLPDGYSHWLVKFKTKDDGADCGAVEQAYAMMASAAGLNMPETALFPQKHGAGYFGIRRFDRIGNHRIHVHTAAGLLNADHRYPSMSYEGLLRATRLLTQDQRYVEQMFARMVFNVFARNRDDHTKNHSFTMNEKGDWTPSPVYDLTFSPGAGGEHAMSIGGNGADPSIDNIKSVAKSADVSSSTVRDVIDRTRMAVDRWMEFATDAGVAKKTKTAIDSVLNGRQRTR